MIVAISSQFVKGGPRQERRVWWTIGSPIRWLGWPRCLGEHPPPHSISPQSGIGRGMNRRDLRDGCQALSEEGRRARRTLQPITAPILLRLQAGSLSGRYRPEGPLHSLTAQNRAVCARCTILRMAPWAGPSPAYLRGEQAISRRLIGSSRSRNYVVSRKRKPAPPIYGLSKGRLGPPTRYRNARPCRSHYRHAARRGEGRRGEGDRPGRTARGRMTARASAPPLTHAHAHARGQTPFRA